MEAGTETATRRRGRPRKAPICANCGNPAVSSRSWRNGPTFDLCENTEECAKDAFAAWERAQTLESETQETVNRTFNGEVNGELHGELIPHMPDLPAAPLGPYANNYGLTLPDELPLEEWCAIGVNQIRAIGQVSMFWLADYLAFGERHYGEQWAQVADKLGYAEQTIKIAKYVGLNIPFVNRMPDKLSFSHHCEVAFLGPKEQRKWLDLAVKNEWTKVNLRDAIREAKAGTSKETAPGQSAKMKKDREPTAAAAIKGITAFGRSIENVGPVVEGFRTIYGRLTELTENEEWDWPMFDAFFESLVAVRDVVLEKLREAVDVQRFRDVPLRAVEEGEEEEQDGEEQEPAPE